MLVPRAKQVSQPATALTVPQDAICLRVHRSTAILAVGVTSFQLV